MEAKKIMTGDYAEKGTYHEELDPNWKYLPVYLEKKKYIFNLMEKFRGKKILDMGCGEGVFVKELKAKGFDIQGLDFNYESDLVKKGSILAAPYADQSFDVILCLDVIEHLNPEDQPKAVAEINRLLKPGGKFICSLPNLAHLASRITFLFLGKLLRTATIDRHPGDRPYGEFKKLIQSFDFDINGVRALFLTCPFLCLWTHFSPSSSVIGHRIYNSIFNLPGLSFLTIFECTKR
ncbi:MAG: class I SAM-dependent methyltransferase [Bacteriovoracaceae bacterium]